MRILRYFAVALPVLALLGCSSDAPVAPEVSPSDNALLAQSVVDPEDIEDDDVKEVVLEQAVEVVRAQLEARLEAYLTSLARTGLDKRVAFTPSANWDVPGDFATIQDAVNAASPGDRIVVDAAGGPYVENVDIATPDLKLEGVDNPEINGTVSIMAADGVRIDGFTIDSETNAVNVYGSDHVRLTNSTIEAGDISDVGQDNSDGIYADDSHNLHVRYLYIEANDEGIEAHACNNLQVRDCEVMAYNGEAMEIDACHSLRIHDSVLRCARDVAVYVNDSNSLQIRDSRLRSRRYEALAMSDCDNGVIVGTWFRAIRDDGIGAESCDNVKFFDNELTDNGNGPPDEGMDLTSCDNWKIYGNIFGGNAGDGIELTNCTGMMLHDNECNNNGGNGININNGTDYCKIGPHNVANDNSRWGVGLSATTEHNEVFQNSFCGNTLGAINNNGTGNRIKKNTTVCASGD